MLVITWVLTAYVESTINPQKSLRAVYSKHNNYKRSGSVFHQWQSKSLLNNATTQQCMKWNSIHFPSWLTCTYLFSILDRFVILHLLASRLKDIALVSSCHTISCFLLLVCHIAVQACTLPTYLWFTDVIFAALKTYCFVNFTYLNYSLINPKNT